MEEDTGVGNFFGVTNSPKKQKVLTASMKRDRDISKQKIKQLLRKLKDEDDINTKNFNFRLGSYVEYGSEIQLLHVDSGCYVQG